MKFPSRQRVCLHSDDLSLLLPAINGSWFLWQVLGSHKIGICWRSALISLQNALYDACKRANVTRVGVHFSYIPRNHNATELFPLSTNTRWHKLKLFHRCGSPNNVFRIARCSLPLNSTVFDFIVNDRGERKKTMAKVFNLNCLCKVRECWLWKSGGVKEMEKVLVWTLILAFFCVHFIVY